MRHKSHALRLVCLVLLVGGFALLGNLAALLRAPLPIQAQAAPDLVVTLRDAAGAGISGAIITVHDRDGAGVLAQAQTDASGTATIFTVLMSDVRVAVTGKGSDGTALKQLASDTGGMALLLDGARTTQLDLRVEVDGTVIPDPQTMLVPEAVPSTVVPAGITVVAPSPRSAAATVQPTPPLIGMAPPVQAHILAPTVSTAASSPAKLVGLVLLVLVMVAVAAQLGMRVWRERRSR